MSHFSVLVIGDDYERQLAPYHEFECTGFDDEYVQNVDCLEEARTEYASHTERRFRDPEGNLHEPYVDRFKREPAAGRFNATYEPPEGWEDIQVPAADCITLATFIEELYDATPLGADEEPDLAGRHKYGWVRVDADGNVLEYVGRTNPNKKWDWYEVGGRWRGFFKAKSGATVKVGRPGVFDNEPTHDADVIRRGDVDFEGMREHAIRKANATYDRYEAATAGVDISAYVPWAKLYERVEADEITRDEARTLYYAQPYVEALKDADLLPFMGEAEEIYGGGREAYVQRAVDCVAVPYAVVKGGEWFGRGEMGWWGMSHGDAPQEEWNRKVQELYDSLDDDTLLTIVDCHI